MNLDSARDLKALIIERLQKVYGIQGVGLVNLGGDQYAVQINVLPQRLAIISYMFQQAILEGRIIVEKTPQIEMQ